MFSSSYRNLFPILLDSIGFVGTLVGIFLGFYSKIIYDPVEAFQIVAVWAICTTTISRGIAILISNFFFHKKLDRLFYSVLNEFFYQISFSISIMTIYFGNWGFLSVFSISYLFVLSLLFTAVIQMLTLMKNKRSLWVILVRVSTNLFLSGFLFYFGVLAYLFQV